MIELLNKVLNSFNNDQSTNSERIDGERKTSGNNPSSTSQACAMKRDWNLGKEVVFQIDHNSLQYCITQRGINSIKIIDFGKIYSPQSNKAQLDHGSLFSEELQRLTKQYDLTRARFGLSISSDEVAVRTIRIPKMPRAEEQRAVYFESDKSFPFALDDSYWAYRRCNQFTSDGGCDVSITVMSLLKMHLADTLNFFKENNISFDFICQDIEALGLTLKSLPEFREGRPYGLLNIRPARTEVSLYDGSYLKFLHHGAFGSLALGQGLHYSTEASSFMPQALDNFAEGLAATIQQALDYYGAQQGIDDIATFYIYGDFSYSMELIDTMSRRYGVTFKRFPLQLFDNFQLEHPEQREIIPVALPVVAVATSRNLLSDFTPASVHENKRNRSFIRHALIAATLTLMSLGAAWTSQRMTNDIANKALIGARQTISNFEASSAYAAYRILKEELVRQEQLVQELKHQSSEHYLTLKDIAALTPSAIHLEYLQYYPKSSGTSTTLTGVVVSQLVAPEVILAEFVARLDGSPLFSNVTLKSHNKSIVAKTRKVQFSLDMDATL